MVSEKSCLNTRWLHLSRWSFKWVFTEAWSCVSYSVGFHKFVHKTRLIAYCWCVLGSNLE